MSWQAMIPALAGSIWRHQWPTDDGQCLLQDTSFHLVRPDAQLEVATVVAGIGIDMPGQQILALGADGVSESRRQRHEYMGKNGGAAALDCPK